ncbi:FAR1 domain-containing protein [Cephalotus follicularis]|uniref:FAR1 domain-containing protein n=1 Tax=Cephalotus follicularis TaxID=3775 RepID=A0A1Q3D032_CEPFO|nr:FAR1 domain-containing protein [Cephalotus follicularis]
MHYSNSAKIPYINQEFDSFDDAYNFYNLYALKKGFGTRKSSSNKSAVTRDVIFKRFVCDKEGFKKQDERDNVRHRCNTREGCMALMEVRMKKHGKWIATKFVEEHSHDLDTPRRAWKHRSHNVSHKNPVAMNLMDQFHSCEMGLSKIVKAINATSGSTSITA